MMSHLVQSQTLRDFSELAMLDAALKAALILALAGVLCWIQRRNSAAVRHRIWTYAVMSALLIPATIAFTPQCQIAIPSANRGILTPDSNYVAVDTTRSRARAPEPFVPNETDLPGLNTLEASGKLSGTTIRNSALHAATESRMMNATLFSAIANHRQIILLVWFVGVIVAVVPFVVAMFRHWCRSFRFKQIDDDEWNSSVEMLSRTLGLGRSPKSFESDHGMVPAVFGVLRPYLVVPSNWKDWSNEQPTI